MNSEKQLIYLASLIHDIGKFYQRADDKGSTQSDILSAQIKNMEGVLCPSWNGKYSHKHVLWTAQFVENISAQLKRMKDNDSVVNPDVLLKLAAAHHNPQNYLEKLIQKADHYSSGVDRSQDTDSWKDAVEEEDRKWDSFKRITMRSVFESVSLSENTMVTYNHKLPVAELSLNPDTFFPKSSGELTPDYKKLWNGFAGEIENIQGGQIGSYSETLLYLLEKYTSRVPSSTVHLPDVSLFDHSKTTAAFAVCLYDYVRSSTYIAEEKVPDENETPFLLVGGDLSGIQRFIYDIAARGAAKNLKGRSFYLQLLVDNIVRLILDRLDLFDANIVYSSGGGFYLLAPNTEDVKSALSKLEAEIGEKLLQSHGTSLAISIDFVAFGEKELFYQKGRPSVNDVWRELSEKLGRKKGRKYQHFIINNYEKFFEPLKVNPGKGKDYITGEELEDNHTYLDKSEGQQQAVNQSTYAQIQLGERLKKTEYWILSKEKLTYFNDKFCIEPAGLGYFNYFLKKQDIDSAAEELRKSADNVRVIFFNKDNFLNDIQKGVNNIYGFTWYGGNDFPVNKFEEPKTFSELSGIEFNQPNYKPTEQERVAGPNLVRLGILRMDVDNLGTIFRFGIPEAKRTFSRYSTLSRSLDYFFKGYLNTIWSSDAEYKEYTQIIYSGGDDLFIVGKWDVLERMGGDIYKSFRRWTCYNPDLTLSGGMALVTPKFPILKGAQFSEVYEKSAKNHQWDSIPKDAFSIFGYNAVDTKNKSDEILFAFNWNHEYPFVQQLKEDIRKMLERKIIPSRFPSEVYDLMQQARFKEDTATNVFMPQNYSVIWLIAYQFKRAMKENKNTEAQSFLESWVKNIMTGKMEVQGGKTLKTKYHSLQILALAARWASLENRSII